MIVTAERVVQSLRSLGASAKVEIEGLTPVTIKDPELCAPIQPVLERALNVGLRSATHMVLD